MYIERITIKRFRSIVDGTFNAKNITVFVGKNDVGMEGPQPLEKLFLVLGPVEREVEPALAQFALDQLRIDGIVLEQKQPERFHRGFPPGFRLRVFFGHGSPLCR